MARFSFVRLIGLGVKASNLVTLLGWRLPEWACPAPGHRVTVAARHEAARFDRDKPQRAHSRGDPATVAGRLRQPEQIEQGEGADGFHATHNGFHLLPKGINITRSTFGFRSM